MVVLGLEVRPKADVAWQLAQPVVVDTLAWYLAGNQLVKPLVWQVLQLADVGMWLLDLPVASLLLWQLAQLVAEVKPLWSTLAPVQVVVLLWQVSHTVTPLWMVVLGLDVRPKADVAWQLAQPVVVDTLAWYLAGSQLVKPLV